ncbi:hypothetical protein M8697_003826, partial [Providencia rettgeri]|nr:hypothetical protein [Providencia rettgeri]
CGKAASEGIPWSIQKYVTWVTERSQHRHSVILNGFTLNSSRCGKAASEGIPWSIQKYVTWVTERSQHRHSVKYNG